MSEVTWLWTSAVMPSDECPRFSDTTFMGTPAVRAIDAAECRRSCRWILGNFAASARTWNLLLTHSGRKATPAFRAKTRSVSE